MDNGVDLGGDTIQVFEIGQVAGFETFLFAEIFDGSDVGEEKVFVVAGEFRSDGSSDDARGTGQQDGFRHDSVGWILSAVLDDANQNQFGRKASVIEGIRGI